jgi:hypothetical protein
MSETKTCGINYFCVGAVLLFGGSISLIPLGFTFVLPYSSTFNWLESMCTVVNSSYNLLQCTCNEDPSINKHCVSKYPCLQVYVQFNHSLLEKVNLSIKLTFSQEDYINNHTNKESAMFHSSHNNQMKKLQKNINHQTTTFHRKHKLELSPFQKHVIKRDISTHYQNKTLITSTTSILLLFRTWSDAFYKKVSCDNTIDEAY